MSAQSYLRFTTEKILLNFVSLPKIMAIDIDWVLAIAYATPFLYFMGVWSHFLMNKMSRHISLLEYALEQKNHYPRRAVGLALLPAEAKC